MPFINAPDALWRRYTPLKNANHLARVSNRIDRRDPCLLRS